MLIGVDMDGVLADFTSQLIRFLDESQGIKIKKSEWNNYYVHEVLNISPEEERKLLDKYFESDYFSRIRPEKGAVRGIRNLAKTNELVVVTARPERLFVRSKIWLEKYFPGNFRYLHHTYNWEGKYLKKSEACLATGVEVLVEDSLVNALDCAAQGIPVFLLNQPWNQGELNSGIARVNSLCEVADKIKCGLSRCAVQELRCCINELVLSHP